MKKLLVLSIISFTAVVGAGEDDWSLNNRFAMWGEYVYFRRSSVNNNKLIVDLLNGTLNSCEICEFNDLCNTRDVVKKFNFESGFRVGAGYTTRRWSLEGTYLWVHEWQGRCSASLEGGLFFSESHPFVLNDYANADHAETEYKSRFENTEINYFRHVTPRKENYISCSWLLGLRYLYLSESLDIAYTKGDSTSHYEIRANNYMPAIQIGGAIEWRPMKHLSWNFVAKVGMGYDWAGQRTFVRDFDDSVTVHHFRAHGEQFPPFLADGAMVVGYQFFKFLEGHIGYQIIYLNGVATAPDQIQKGEHYRHHVKIIGQAIIYGLYGGLTFSF